MVIAAGGDYSRVFTVSFCNTCTDTAVSMKGGTPYEIGLSDSKRTIIAGAPLIKLEDILSAVRKAGINEGTCSVKVNLTTKEVVFIESDKWVEHECTAGQSVADIFEKMMAKAMASKDGSASTSSIRQTRVPRLSSRPPVAEASSQTRYADVSSTVVGSSAYFSIGEDGVVRGGQTGPRATVSWTDESGQQHTDSIDPSMQQEGTRKFGPGSYTYSR